MKTFILNLILIIALAAVCVDAGIHMERTRHICHTGFPRMYLRTHEEWQALLYHPGVTCQGISKWNDQRRIWYRESITQFYRP